MSEIEIRELRKVYGSTVASDSLNAVFEAGSVTCLLGPSGCGKTTLLRMIAGLESPDSGSVLLGGKDVTRLPTGKRDFGMVFQYPVVYRGMSVRENLELPLKEARGKNRLNAEERADRVAQLLVIMDLQAVAGRSVDALTNGVRQKVAVARAMIRRPDVVIFDEPVTNVDIVSKLEIQRDIKRVARELGQTVLYVTHDQTEAMTLADRIVLLKDGRIVESGPPREVFNFPSSTFGGHFLGSPGMNFFPGTVIDASDSTATISASVLAHSMIFSTTSRVGADTVVGIRPERIVISDRQTPNAVRASVVTRAVGVGGRWILNCMVGESRVRIKAHRSNLVSLHSEVWASVTNSAACLFDSEGRRVGVGLAVTDGLSTKETL